MIIYIYIYSVCVCTYTCMCSHILGVYDISCAFAVVLLYTAGSVQWPFFIKVSTPFALLTWVSLHYIIHELGIPFLSNRFWTMFNCKIVGSGWLARPKISCAGPPRSTDPTNMIGYKSYISYIPLIPGISIPLCHALICILIKLLALPCFTHIFVTFGQFKFVK